MRHAALAGVAVLWLAAAPVGAAELCAGGPALRARGAPALGAEYRQLQSLRGHFDGGSWQPSIDRWGERKHCVMDALRGLLAQQRPVADAVLALLGPPDARWRRGEPAARLLPGEWHDGPFDELLWYRWRGTRDGLAVALVAGHVDAVAWSYAAE